MVEKRTQWHQILTDGGMGDLIGCLVAVDWNINHFPSVKFNVWVPDYLFLFARHVLPRGSAIRPFSKAKEYFDQKVEGMTTEWCTNHTCIRTHPVDYGFHMLSDRHIYDMNQKNYLQIHSSLINIDHFDLPKNYVVIACTGVEPVRTMPAKTANEIVDYLLGKEITPVFMGQTKKASCGIGDFAIKGNAIEIDYFKGINLLDKTTITQAARIIHGSKAFVGMDGGLLHLAGCTDAEIICGFTASSPSHVAPIRKGTQTHKMHVVEPDEHPNKYYQTWASFKKGNFQKFQGWEEIVTSMRSEKFISCLEKVL